MVKFQNGDIALARLRNFNWNLPPDEMPNSPIVGVAYLGNNLDTPYAQQRFNTAMQSVPARAQATLIAFMDHGLPGLAGVGASTTPSGKPIGRSKITGGDVQEITNPSTPAVNQVVPTLNALGSLLSSPLDFLNWIAWIFHPLNILRAVEFVIGAVLFFTGIRFQLSSRSSGLSAQGVARVTRQLTDATPIGRVRRTAGGRRRGRYEGQREAARLQARREATRTERTASAHERERITREARETQRRGKARREN